MRGERAEMADIREARRMIERMRDRLLHPTFAAIESCAADLGRAVDCIRRLDAGSAAWQGSGRCGLEAEVIALRRGVHVVEALLTNAGKFYGGWARLLSPDQAPPNYTAAGESFEAAAQTHKLVLHG
jgi:hypothetical protein